MKKFLSIMLSLALIYLSICFLTPLLPITYGQIFTKVQGYAQQGGQKVSTQGLTSSTNVQRSYPNSTVTVFDSGTSTVSTIYSNSSGTPKSNPFTADSSGYWFFYGIPGKRYDVRFSGTGISSPFTLGDFKAPISSYILVNVDDFGAVGDGKVRQTATMSPASTTLTCSDCSFSSSDVGKKIDVSGAGSAFFIYATITARSSSTSITINTRASFTTTNQAIRVGGRTVNDGVSTAGSNIITSATANFQTYDIGRRISIANAGAKNLITTITGFTNSTTVTLAAAATGTVSNKQVVFGTDDTTAFQNALNSTANTLYIPDPIGDCYFFSSRNLSPALNGPIFTALSISSSNKSLVGDGPDVSKLYFSSTVIGDAATATQGITIAQASNIELRNLSLWGTNHEGQPTEVISGFAADGLYIDTVGPISNISSYNCYFNEFMVIGWHCPGQTAGTIIKDFTIINCRASKNGADGFNPNPGSGNIFIGNRMEDNGTGGIEAIGDNGIYSNNIAKGNFSVGYSIGGDSDPNVDDNVIFTGNLAENNLSGIILGPNTKALNATANVARFNYEIGILCHDQVDRTLANNNTISNNIILSNGGIGSATPFGISVSGTTNTTLRDNDIYDEGINGFQQKIGIVGNGCTGLNLLENTVLGHSIQDYSLNNCPSTDFINNISSAIVAQSGTTTLIYPSPTFNNLTINQQENLVPTVISDTVLNPFTPTNIRIAYITLTANRVFVPFNGTDGQLLTLIFVQDGTGNRTLTYAGIRGATNISAGQAAGQANVQTFIFRTGLGWIAYTAAIQNQ